MAPPDAYDPILLFMRDGHTEETVTQAYAEALGLEVGEVRNRAMWFSSRHESPAFAPDRASDPQTHAPT